MGAGRESTLRTAAISRTDCTAHTLVAGHSRSLCQSSTSSVDNGGAVAREPSRRIRIVSVEGVDCSWLACAAPRPASNRFDVMMY